MESRERVGVLLIDFGDAVVVHVENVRFLSPHFVQVPCNSFSCRLRYFGPASSLGEAAGDPSGGGSRDGGGGGAFCGDVAGDALVTWRDFNRDFKSTIERLFVRASSSVQMYGRFSVLEEYEEVGILFWFFGFF